MTDAPRRPPAQDRERVRRRHHRRRVALLWLLRLALLGLAFFAGLAIGRAVEDAPEPGGSQTLVRTLDPGTIPPDDRTVTVTVTAP